MTENNGISRKAGLLIIASPVVVIAIVIIMRVVGLTAPGTDDFAAINSSNGVLTRDDAWHLRQQCVEGSIAACRALCAHRLNGNTSTFSCQ